MHNLAENPNQNRLPSFVADESGNIDGEQIHKFLGVKTRYRDWAPRVIEDCFLTEHVDYQYRSILSASNNGSEKRAFFFSPDAVKAIGMKKGTGAQGKAIRDYFIMAEKAGRELAEAIKSADPVVLRKLADMSESCQKLETENKLLEVSLISAEETIKNITPMAEYGTKVFNSENTYTATNIASELGFRTAKALNQFLKKKGVIKKGTGAADWTLCSKFTGYDLTKNIQVPVKHSDGWKTHLQMRWTRKGFDWLIKSFKGEKVR